MKCFTIFDLSNQIKLKTMKATIEIQNQYFTEKVSLSTLLEMIAKRRMNALDRKKIKVNVHTKDSENLQIAAHYTSFAIRSFNLQKALEVFNAGGVQSAKVIN